MLVRFDYPGACKTMVDDFFATDVMPSRSTPALDVLEQENELVVNVELPGMKKEDVKITFENNVLTVSGERKPADVPENVKVLLKETRDRAFSRSLRIAMDVVAEKISAEMNNGILTVTLPKEEETKPREIKIN